VRVEVENVSNGSVVEALWALGAPGPKKRLERPERAGWGAVERDPKTASKGAAFCRFFTGIRNIAKSFRGLHAKAFGYASK
jgi:hypothetical protein